MYKGGYVYITSSPDKCALYVGVTSNLYKRIWEHRTKVYPGSYSAKYNCVMLVYYLQIDSIEQAILEEKRIKAGSRKQKEALINNLNPEWKDLWENISNSY